MTTKSELCPLWSWVSPWDTYKTVASVIEAASRVHMPGMEHGVLLPTVYDDWPQSQLSNNLGPDLKVSSPENARHLREIFEANGLKCGGWSVPRATGDVAAEGFAHGQMAAAFDYFILNFEDGWDGFWTQDGGSIVDIWLGAFWAGIEDSGATERLNGQIGVTWVTNTGMMQVVSEAEAVAWVGGTNFDCLEAYVPGDAGLDPGNAIRIWKDRLARIGVTDRPVVPILERGDLPTLIGQYAHETHGAQIWTLSIAAAYEGWPAVEDQPTEPETPAQMDKDELIASLRTTIAVMGGDVADTLANTGVVLAKQAKAARVSKAAIATSATNVNSVVEMLHHLRAESEAIG